MVRRLEKAMSDSAKDREAPPKKRKILNGIGKILGGAIAGAGNVLLLFGTIVAPNPATGYGAIASSAIALAGVMQQETVVQQPYLRFRLLPPRLDFMLISGQRVKTDVVRPPRGVNSPRTTHHSGFTAATMSRRILLTAFS